MSKRLWTADFRRIFLANLFLMVTYNMLMSVFLLFLIERGGTDLQGGIATYFCSICALVMRPAAGWHLDHKSRRTLTMVSLIILAFLPWGYFLAPTALLLIVIRAIHGLLESSASTGLTTNAYDAVSKEHFSAGVGQFGFSNAIGTAVGPALGLYLWRNFGDFVFFASISLCTLAAYMVLRKFNFHPIEHRETFHLKKEQLADFLFEKRALPASLMEGFVGFYCGCVSTYMARFLALQGNFADAGLYFACQACGTFCSRLVVGEISEKHGEGPLVWSSFFMMTTGGLLITYSTTALPVYIGGMILGVSYGFMVTGMQIMSVRIVPPHRRGAAASTYCCAWDIFSAVGSLAAGILVTFFSYRFAFTAALAVCPLFLLTYVLKVSHHPSAFRVWKRQHTA